MSATRRARPARNAQLVRDIYEAFGQGDTATVLGALDAQVEWREAEGNPYEPSGKPWIGPDAIMQNLFVKLATEWGAFTIHPKEFHDAGDSVIVEVIVEGRYTGAYIQGGGQQPRRAVLPHLPDPRRELHRISAIRRRRATPGRDGHLTSGRRCGRAPRVAPATTARSLRATPVDRSIPRGDGLIDPFARAARVGDPPDAVRSVGVG